MDSSGAFPFHPTVVFDGPYWVHDFTRPSPEGWTAPYPYSVGRYDEHRPAMYTTELFEGERNHHVGLDLGAPVHTPVHAFDAGEVAMIAVNDEDGSYGPTLITKHTLRLPTSVGGPLSTGERTFWVLYGQALRAYRTGSRGTRSTGAPCWRRWATKMKTVDGRLTCTSNCRGKHPSTVTCLAWSGPKTVWRPWRSTPIQG